MPQVKQILFDCDNTLVMSEARAFAACANLTNEVLEKHGVSARYDAESLLVDFVGQNFRGMLNGLQSKYDFKMSDDEVNEYVNKELDAVIKALDEQCDVCEGVEAQLQAAKASGKYGMAVVSTSALPRVVASLEKTGLIQYFKRDEIYSAATSLNPPSSKPNPAIYFHAMKELGVTANECVAIEDSRSGATAAKNASVPLIGYVGPYYTEGGPEKVKQMEKTLKEECNAFAVMHKWSEFPDIMSKYESS